MVVDDDGADLKPAMRFEREQLHPENERRTITVKLQISTQNQAIMEAPVLSCKNSLARAQIVDERLEPLILRLEPFIQEPCLGSVKQAFETTAPERTRHIEPGP